jgi:hypothetical protein
MEIDITEFFRNAAPRDYSASAAELGQDAGRITWNHAIEDSPDYMLIDSDEKREAFRAFVDGFGAWSAEEIAAWSDIELNALCLQWIAGDMREGGMRADWSADDWKEYESDDSISHNIFLADDGKVYFYIGR